MFYLYRNCKAKAAACLLILLWALPAAAMPENGSMIIVRNNQAFERTEILRISSRDFGKHPTSFYPVITRNQTPLVSQPADINKDGVWDILFVEVHLLPFSADTLSLHWQTGQPRIYRKLTNVRFSLRSSNGFPQREITDSFRLRGYIQDISKPVYQLEGPGIENDKVAFRVFFDHRNGKDIYGKLIADPVLDTIGINGSWHTLQNWGMDILHTGQSLGAGAFAVKEAGAGYKLADADSSVFTQLYEGPLAASFRLDYYHWDAGTKKLRGSEVITLQKGDYFYTTTLHLPLTAGQTLLQGFANFYHDSLMVLRHNPGYCSVATFGKQAEGTSSMLGLAVMVPQSSFLSSGCDDSTGTLPNSCYVDMKMRRSISTLFFACWEKTDARFTEKQGFISYLREVADRLAHPVQITMSKKI